MLVKLVVRLETPGMLENVGPHSMPDTVFAVSAIHSGGNNRPAAVPRAVDIGLLIASFTYAVPRFIIPEIQVEAGGGAIADPMPEELTLIAPGLIG